MDIESIGWLVNRFTAVILPVQGIFEQHCLLRYRAMGMRCRICGKKPVVGNQKTYRGKAKYLGGVGKKITGINKRVFKPNLQSIRVSENGVTVRMWVCVQCIRSGRIQKPVKRLPFSHVSV
jgi:large subunit ribosomal protein L28